MNISSLIKNEQLEQLFFEGNFGIEKEGLRTDFQQNLAMTNHPESLGSRLYHPYLQTDFSEAQPEIVTPAMPSLKETFNWLEALHDVLHRSMAEDEYVWPYSMPNLLPDNDEDIPIIRYDDPDAKSYRMQLAERYGRKKQTISGIHFNFSFNEDFIEALFKAQKTVETKIEFQNDLYIKLASNFMKYEWILLYLFGASPYAEAGFYNSQSDIDVKKPTDYVRSLRNSSFGYHNHDEVVVRYDSVEHYVQDIEYYVETGHLSEAREFYGNARLRGKGEQLQELLDSGVQYIEFRSIDINPLDRIGISYEQGQFYHLFFLLMVWMNKSATSSEIATGQKRNLLVADEYPYADTEFKIEGLQLLDEMTVMVEALNLDENYKKLVQKAKIKFEKPETTLSARVANVIEEEGYLNSGKRLGLEHKEYSTTRPYILNGFSDMELSTQLLMFEVLRVGVKLEVLDRKDQFLKLSHQDHIEYVRNGNMTSKDTTISHFIMENKTVTKKILHEQGFEVPSGEEFYSVEDALNQYPKYKNQSIVVKPKSTNYGIGISVFKKSPAKEDYREALEIAFAEDDTVLVEEFVAGTEYRFFILNDKVEAILLRVPANVIGDGKLTISELIDEKNSDPLRADNHRAPMGILQKGSIEKLNLKEQGLEFESIPEEGQQIFLRENSNISTGGDSIDFTDRMHESYKEIAVGIAQAIGVQVTGIDLIIPDYEKASTKAIPNYSCIEANFNPAMNMHAYVTEGKGRPLAKYLLEMLFPEVTSGK